MGANSSIEWTDHTFNPWMGCTRVSEGCTNCYAEAMMDHRLGKVNWGPKGPRVRTGANNWRAVHRWNRECIRRGWRDKVFCASLADVFDAHPSILPEWRAELWETIAATTQLDWLLLTKRPENWPVFLPTIEPGQRFAHVRLGVTIEHQEALEKRLYHLKLIDKLGWPTFISYEPALGPVDWSFLSNLSHRSAGGSAGEAGEGGKSDPPDTWLIAGGESGPHARPPHPDWFRTARDAAAGANVPFFFKQWGEYIPESCAARDHQGAHTSQTYGKSYLTSDGEVFWRAGKHAAGRLLDGTEHSAFPPSPSFVIPAQAGTQPPRGRAASEPSEAA